MVRYLDFTREWVRAILLGPVGFNRQEDRIYGFTKQVVLKTILNS